MSDNTQSADELLRQLAEDVDADFQLNFQRDDLETSSPRLTSTTLRPFITEATQVTREIITSTVRMIYTSSTPPSTTTTTTSPLPTTPALGEGPIEVRSSTPGDMLSEAVNEVKDGVGQIALSSILIYVGIGISSCLGVLIAICVVVYYLPGEDGDKLGLIRRMLYGLWRCLMSPCWRVADRLFPAPSEAQARDVEAFHSSVHPSDWSSGITSADEAPARTPRELPPLPSENLDLDAELAAILAVKVSLEDQPIESPQFQLEHVYDTVEGGSRSPTPGAEPAVKSIYPDLTKKDAEAWHCYRESAGYESDLSSHFSDDAPGSEGDEVAAESLVAGLEESFKDCQVRNTNDFKEKKYSFCFGKSVGIGSKKKFFFRR